MIRALIFDMDGTLVDSERLHFRAWRQILADYGIGHFPLDDFNRYVGVSNEQLANDYIAGYRLQVDTTTLVKKKQHLYLRMICDIEPMVGVRDILARYHDRYLLAVASSSDRIELHSILEVLGYTNYFSQVVGGDMVSRKKPDPEIYLQTMALLQVAPHESVAFEDSVAGIAAAKNAGMYGIAVPSPLQKIEEFSRADTILARIDLADDHLLQTFAG